MKNILVPTDFSDTSKNALHIACEIATENKIDITLFHSYGVPHSSSTVMIDLSDVMKESAETEMINFSKEFKDKYPKINISTKCNMGPFLFLILDETKKYDLIVMGTNGSSGVEEVFLGSNTSSLIQKIKTPLLAIPHNFMKHNFNKAIIALSTDNENTEGNIEYLIKMNSILGIERTEILNIQKEDKTDERAIERFIKKVNRAFEDVQHKFTFIGNNDIESAILTHSRKNDLIVVLSKSYSFFEGLFHKSISKKLAMHSENPLLIIKEL